MRSSRYRCFDPVHALAEQDELNPNHFTDLTIRDNWQRYFDIKKRLAKAASEPNTESIDWNSGALMKWRIYCKADDDCLDYSSNLFAPGDGIYFTSKEAAEKAVEIVGQNDLIWMLRDFQPYIGYSTERV